jgi:hypothetical protein
MGKVTFTNITVGEGKLFVGPSEATVDADIATNGDDSTYNVGATQEGVAISWEPDMVDIEVDQFGDAARVIQSKQKVMVKTTLAEATLYNLSIAWGYDDGVAITRPGLVSGYSVASGGTMNIGIHSVYPTERYCRIEGNAPGSTSSTTVYRTFRNRRVVQYAASEFSLQRSDNVKFAVEFRLLPDSSQTGREYGYIQDSTTVPYAPYI